MMLSMTAPISETAESRCEGSPPAARGATRAAGALRDWRGVKYRLTSTTDEELLNVLVHAQRSYEDIERFVAELQAEWVRRQFLST